MDIEEEIKKISKRFNDGTETIENILNCCRNYLVTFENGKKMRLVEMKYLDKLVEEYKKLLAEREENKKKIYELEEHQRKFYNGELYTAKQLKQIEKNQNKYFINKQKVKDKIEELKNNLKFISCDEECNKCFSEEGKTLYRGSNFTFCYAYYQIKILQELLEDK